LKTLFFGGLLAGTGMYCLFQWLTAIENVNDPKIAFFGSRV
jgi:hypothetical protein